MQQLSADQTADLLPYPALVGALATAMLDYAGGALVCPERLVVPMPGGLLLSMPAVAPDLTIHKLLTICSGNKAHGLPAIQGQVSGYHPQNGKVLLTLDAPAATARRTAAISILGILTLHGQPSKILLIGTGAQATGHADAIQALFPEAKVCVQGRSLASAEAFCHSLPHHSALTPVEGVPDDADVIITATSSAAPVYSLPAQPGRLIVAVGSFTPGAAEIAPTTVQGSRLYVDDLVGAPHEAGDYIQAGIDWADVQPLASILGQPPTRDQPIMFKSVGCAAWDLAACRVALTRLAK